MLKLTNKVWNNPPIRVALEEIAGAAKLDSKVLVRAVKTRWNTVTEVLERALQMREVLAQLCDMNAFNSPKSGGVQLRRYTIEDDEWEILEQLFKLLHVSLIILIISRKSNSAHLQPFLYATKIMSKGDYALVHNVIPSMDILTEHLDAFKDNADLKAIIRVAAARGLEIMNKYYSRTDESEIYRNSMSKCLAPCIHVH